MRRYLEPLVVDVIIPLVLYWVVGISVTAGYLLGIVIAGVVRSLERDRAAREAARGGLSKA